MLSRFRTDGRKIRIVGRRDTTIKVNAINVLLSELAESLEIKLLDCPLTLISEADPVRGESFSVVMGNSDVPLVNRQRIEQLVKAEVQRLFGRNVYLVRYGYSDAIKSTTSGKNKIIMGGSRSWSAQQFRSTQGGRHDQI